VTREATAVELWLILVILLVVLLVAAVPRWPYSAGWGYSPAGIIAVVILVLLILWLLGVIEFTSNGTNNTQVDQSP